MTTSFESLPIWWGWFLLNFDWIWFSQFWTHSNVILFLAYFSKCMYNYEKVWFTILWGLLDAGGLQYITIYTTQQYWLSLLCLWSLWWLCHCDGFIFVMALSLFRLLHQTMWHNRVGLSLVYSLFVWLTLWIWWHYCYRSVMVHACGLGVILVLLFW